MKKRFIVALASSTPEQNSAFKAFLDGVAGLGWWHWLPNLWLLVDLNGTSNASGIRDRVRDIYAGVNSVVFELRHDDDTWAGFGPVSDQRNMFKWIKDSWKK